MTRSARLIWILVALAALLFVLQWAVVNFLIVPTADHSPCHRSPANPHRCL